MFDFYNPVRHKGELPIRVLSYNFLDWFQNISPDFKDEAIAEIAFRELYSGIQYNIVRERITNVAAINNSRQITLYENYNQFLWCICYSLFVIFYEGVQKPLREGRYSGKLDFDDPSVEKSIQVFDAGFDLLSAYDREIFYQIPNPETYPESDSFYIAKTNGCYVAAMTFILLHEYAHQFLGHLDYSPNSKESKRDEFAADNYAISRISFNFASERGKTFKFGIVAGICSLIMLDSSLSGGETHPDLDLRLKSAMEKLNLAELDDLWGIASMAFRLWALKYGVEIELPSNIDNYKQLFDLIITKVKHLKM